VYPAPRIERDAPLHMRAQQASTSPQKMANNRPSVGLTSSDVTATDECSLECRQNGGRPTLSMASFCVRVTIAAAAEGAGGFAADSSWPEARLPVVSVSASGGVETTPARGKLRSLLPVDMEMSSLRKLIGRCGVLEAPRGVLCSVGLSLLGEATGLALGLAAFPWALSGG